MDNTCDEMVLRIIDQSKRKAIGRISQKEVKGSLLITALFRTFIVSRKADQNTPDQRNKSRIQEMIGNNTMPPIGKFHFTDFSEEGFLHDLNKEFILKKRIN